MNILVLHKIVQGNPVDWADVSLNFFTEMLHFIKQRNLEVTSINNWKKNSTGDVVLTFDDGFVSDFELVFPLLIDLNMTATFFIVPDFVGTKGYMTWENLKQLSDAGMEIGSHSLTHKYLNTLSEKDLFSELRNSKIHIEKMIGKEVNSFAYPFGGCSQKTHKFGFESGYKNICNSSPGLSSFKKKILSRNSIHSNLKSTDLERLIFPTEFELTFQKFGYMIRTGLKHVLGVKNYVKLRKFIY